MRDFLAQAAKLLKKQKQYRRQMVVFLCLAVIVTFGTVTALKLYGQAMTHQVEVLDCQYEVHEHTDDCYEKDENGNLGTEPVCGYADYVVHVHNDSCYDEKGDLVCTLEEREPHEHTEECFVTEKVLICELEETEEAEAPEIPAPTSEPTAPEEPVCGKEPHTHGEGCYEDTLVCGFAEEHVHGEACASQTLTCAAEEHAHGEGCYDADGNLTCGLEEHTHQEGCYTTEYTCGKEEHTHTEGCHERKLTCALEEHEHIETCYAQADATSAEPQETPEAAEESETPAHIHTDECYEEVTRVVCGELELHTHDDSCYDEECFDEDGNLIEGSLPSCELPQLEEHVHTEECFKTVELTPEEVAALNQGAKLHIHTEDCYDGEGNLICGHDATHIHLPECYDDAGKLICGYGTSAHVHEAKCYDAEGKLICGYETATHPHNESCYDAEGNLQCGYETATHVHGESCYDEDGNVICGYEAAVHAHEATCYDAAGNLICGYGTAPDAEDAEKLGGTFTYEADDYTLEIHVQTDIPTESPEPEEPVESTTESGSEAEAPDAEEGSGTEPSEAESQPVEDDSTEESKKEANTTGIEELSEVHEGDTDTTLPETEESQEGSEDAPEATDPDEEEGQPEQDTQILIADEASGLTLKMSPLDAGEEIYAEMADYIRELGGEEGEGGRLLDLSVMELHVYRDGTEIDITNCTVAVNITPKAATAEELVEAFGEEGATEEDTGIIVSALRRTADGIQESGSVFLTPDMAEVPVLQNAVAENGVLAIARYVNNRPITKSFKDDNFIVTATYKANANIPAGAKLLVEQITEESDSEHYAERQAQYQEALGDETATMRALLKIGFYVEDENGEFTVEVEPESPVTITIQFLDEDGLAEGMPITVVHFAEEGTELLEGSEVLDNSTTFQMESFSEIAVGYGVENVKVPVNEELKYETEEFEVTFRIEGEVNVPIVDTESEEETGAEGEDAVPGDSEEGETVESGTGDEAVAEEAGAEDAEIPEGVEGGEAEGDSDAEADAAKTGEGISVIIENSDLDKELEFRVDPLDEDAEEYAKAAAAVYAEGTDGEEELDDQLFLQVLSYKVTYDGKKLDLSGCTVTAEVKPSEALVEYAETAVDPMTLDLDGDKPIADDLDLRPEVVITAVELAEDQAESKIADAMVVNYEALKTPMLLTLRTLDTDGDEGIAAFSGTSLANPTFTVQYYANLDMLKMDADPTKVETLKVIDTTGGKLPKNGNRESAPLLGIQANKEPQNVSSSFGNDAVTVATENKLTEVYSEKEYHYITSPSLTYFNILAENGNYVLDEIWVLKNGGDKTSIERSSWDIYDCKAKDWHFTNREETSKEENDFIYIREDAVIRLVCNVTTSKPKNDTMFYDYDVSNGNIYSSKDVTKTVDRGTSTTYDSKIGGKWYLYTDKQGINNNPNNNSGGTNAKQVLGFGNGPGVMLSGMGEEKWNGYELNKANEQSYGDCTFELVTKLNVDGTIKYADGVNAPNMFNDGSANGKTDHEGHLTFERKGDTYTLIEAEAGGTTIKNLDKFYGRKNWNGSRYIWSNLFYPLDSVSSAGTKEHDIKFGDTATFAEPAKLWASTKTNEKKLPESDDGKAHNHYFGMYYTVEFDLTEEYVGPLEYIFYGDDDMWVFLNGEGKKVERSKDDEGNEVVTKTPKSIDGKLICDIGGVHSSVGEYVNLWDYIDKGTEGHYTLSFFYTERGASGSTCWMQFTLPSVSFATPKTTTGQMEIKKVVTGVDTDADEEFGFGIKFYNSQGVRLRDNYAYKKTAENGDVIDNDLLIWDDAKFFMKANETIKISYLPIGTKFEITEIGPVEVQRNADGEVMRDEKGNPIWKEKNENPYIPSIDGGDVATNNPATVTGTIKLKEVVTVTYNNIHQFALPETGGSGTILYTMAGGIVLLFGAGFLYKKKFRERRA